MDPFAEAPSSSSERLSEARRENAAPSVDRKLQSTNPQKIVAILLRSTKHSTEVFSQLLSNGWEKRQFLPLRFCRSRRKCSALKNMAGALHTDGGWVYVIGRLGSQNGNPG
jgi:hypothetical protein